MRIKITTVLLVSLFALLFYSSTAQTNTQFNQLVFINKEWNNQPDVDVTLKTNLALSLTEIQLIQLHLTQTEKLLRGRSTEGLTAQQVTNRLKNLAVLHKYMLDGKFPTNTKHTNRQPYFIDENNVYCAAGFLMQQSGYDNLARDINKTQNYSYLKDINHPKLMEWVYQSGLTIDELALIQPAYGIESSAHIVEFHYNNTGTDVDEYIEIEQRFNSFSQQYSIPFDRVLFYDDNQILYKTLLIGDMQLLTNGAYKFYHYTFPTTESFADLGKIELWGTGSSGLQLIERTTYTSTSTVIQDFNLINPMIYNFSVGESESTTIGHTLTYCGGYKNPSWSLSALPHTMAFYNPCLITPIGLKDFSFTTNNKKVDLSWQVEPNLKNKQFIIERSADGNIYTAIGAVNANAAKANYLFTDNNPQYINHYRLKLIETDNKFTYSKVLYVKVEQASVLTLLQNIVADKLNYQISSNNAKNIVVFNIHGQQVYSSTAKQGNATIATAGWSSGKYIVRLFTTTGEFYTQQFQKL